MQDLSEYIQGLKQQLKMQDQELARELNTDEQTVLRWCNGEEVPGEDACIRLAFIAAEDPAKVLILKQLASASTMSRPFWEKISIKFRDGRTVPKPRQLSSQDDRRRSIIQFSGVDRRSVYERRRGLDRRLLLAS